MKKVLLVLAMAGASTAAMAANPMANLKPMASVTNGFYVEGALGQGKTKIDAKFTDTTTTPATTETVKGSKKGTASRIGLGVKVNPNVRVAVDYTQYKKFDETKKMVDAANSSVETTRVQVKPSSIGISAIYDFAVPTVPVKPYVGARLGFNKLKAEVDETETKAGVSKVVDSSNYKESKTKVGLGVMAGVAYAVTPNVDLDLGYRYNKFDDLTGKKDNVGYEIKPKASEISLAARYTF